jgi:ATP-dependent DNA helicase RecG
MLSPEQVKEVLTSTEADRIERTRSVTNTDKFREAICSFSNDMPGHGKPGYLLVGVEDDGSLSPDLAITDELQKQFASYRDDGQILPQPMLSVFKQAHPDGGEFLVVEVHPSDLTPVRYRGRVHIRVGPRKATASESEERRLLERRSSRFRTFDITPCPDATLEDLDLDLFMNSYRRKAIDPEVIKENGRELVLQLAALHFYNLNRDCPTNAGCIVFGKDPLLRYPGSYVQYVKFGGETLGSDVEESRIFKGNLLELMWTVSRFIESSFTEKPVFEAGLRERVIWDYPPEAMRELLVNAVLHREYQSNSPVRFYFFPNRIEIHNVGGLYGEASPENFPSVTDYRNPVLAEVLMVMNYANRFGRGISRAQQLLALNGNQPAQFELGANHVKVTVFKHPER